MSKSQFNPHYDRSRQRWVLNIPKHLSETGRRQRLIFEGGESAERAAALYKKRTYYWGESLNILTPERMVESAGCYKMLGAHCEKTGDTVTLHNAVLAYITAYRDRTASVTLDALFTEYLRTHSHRSTKYLRQIAYCRKRCDSLSTHKVSDLHYRELEAVLEKVPSGNRAAYYRYLRAVLGYAVRRGYAKENPISRIVLGHRPRRGIEVLEPEVVEAMFCDARENRPALLPVLTLGFFVGIRMAEISRMLWSDILLEQGVAIVRASISKTRRTRHIPLTPNAVKWLSLLSAPARGSDSIIAGFTPQTLRTARRANYQAAVDECGGNARWPQNAMRHSFATYHLARHRNLDELALVLGHTTDEVSQKHYADGADPIKAERYWNLTPNISH